MNIYNTLLFIFISSAIYGQIQQVSVGPNYAEQVFYNLETEESITIGNNSWDLSFSSLGTQDAAIFINESSELMGSPIELYIAPITNWEDPITDTSIFVDSLRQYNSEGSWLSGAFNNSKDPDSPFDYGWGAYNPMTHTVEGNKIFVIKNKNGSFTKLEIESLAGATYNFRYANLDGTNEKTASLTKGDNPVMFFSLQEDREIKIDIEYHMIFSRYAYPTDDGSGNLQEYNVTGVLCAPGAQAVMADDIDPDTVLEEDYADQYSSEPISIGHDWKSFDFTTGWVIDENRVYFVKTPSENVYKVTFYDFEGSSTGIITFDKTFLKNSSSRDEQFESFEFYPNPVSNIIYFKIDDVIESAQLYNINGKLLRVLSVDESSIAIPNEIRRGTYIIILRSNDKSYINRIVKN